MPIYDFKCDSCKATTERMQRYDDDPPICKKCCGAMSRMVSVTNFSLKGAGWYKDHYGLKSPKKNQS